MRVSVLHRVLATPGRRSRPRPRCCCAAAAEQRFADWCQAAGAASPALQVAHFALPGGQSYRGLRAVRDVPLGPLFSVPLALCLHSQHPLLDWPSSTPAARLATRLLLADAEPSSPLRPYLDILPRDLHSLGCFACPLPELQHAVQDYAPLLRLRARTEQLDAVAAPHVLAALGGSAHADASLAWAMAIVRTRAFEVSPGVDIFCPMLDMANHSHDAPHLEWQWNADAQAMEVSVVRPLAAGEEAFTSYGQRDNDGFLLWGGFITCEMNPHDTVEVFDSLKDAASWWVETAIGPALAGEDGQSSLDGDDAVRVARRVDADARQSEGGGDVRVSVCLGADWQVDERLVDLFEELAANEALLGPGLAQRAAVQAVRARAQQVLGAWPTNQTEDAELLASTNLHPHIAACVQFRVAKKRLLESYLER